MKKAFVFALIAVLLLSSFAGCGGGQQAASSAAPAAPAGGAAATSTEKFTLNFNSSAIDNTAWNMGCKRLAELVDERTNGNVKITVYPNDTLAGGNQAKAIEQVMGGITEMDAHSNVTYTVLDEAYGVISLPFLYRNPQEADPIIRGSGKEAYAKMLEEDNLILLGIAENGMRQLTTNTPVASMADIKGLKIRVPGIQMYLSIFSALGANPISMNFSELFTALQQNTVDGQENPVDLIAVNKFYEVQKYVTRWNYSYDVIFYVINKDVFNSMPADYQQILLEAGTEACDYQIELNRSREADQLKLFADNNMTVIDPTDEATAEFRSVCGTVFEQYEELLGKEVVDAFRPAA